MVQHGLGSFLSEDLQRSLDARKMLQPPPMVTEVLDSIFTIHPRRMELQTTAATITAFMHTITPIFSPRCIDLIKDNVQYFNLMVDPQGRVADVYIGECTVVEWVEVLVGAILAAINKSEASKC